MHQLWQALLARLAYWLTPKQYPLSPGICECGHLRCVHKKGVFKCIRFENAAYPCGCQFYIKRKEGTDDEIPTPSPQELRRLISK